MLRFSDFSSTFWMFLQFPHLAYKLVIHDRLVRYMCQTTCSVSYTCLYEIQSLTFRGSPAQKNTKMLPRVRAWRFGAELALAYRTLESRVPLNIKVTPQKLEVTKQEVIFHAGGSTGSVFSHDGCHRHLQLQNMLPFLYYLTIHQQI